MSNVSSLDRLRNKKSGRVKFNETHNSENIYGHEPYVDRPSPVNKEDYPVQQESFGTEFKKEDSYQMNDYPGDNYPRNDYPRNDYPRDDYQRNDYQRNDYHRNDYHRNDYPRKEEPENNSSQYSSEESDFLNSMSVISNNIKEKGLVNKDENRLDPVLYEPSVRSLIRRNSVLNSKPNISLILSCDYFKMDVNGDKVEVVVNEFRKELNPHLDCIFKPITRLVIQYKEDVIVDSTSLNASVKSKVDISSTSDFKVEDKVDLGSALETMFDRLGIGYLLD